MWTNLQDAEDLFTFTEETLNGKFHFLCSDSNFKHKMKRLQIPQKRAYEKFYVDKKNLRTRYCRRKFIKNLLSENRKENM